MRILMIMILVVFALLGCATTSPSCAIPVANGKDATAIIIYRPATSYGILYSTPLSINNCAIESLSHDSYLIYKLPAGHHRIAAERRAMAYGGDGVIAGFFEAGKVYYLHYSIGTGGAYYVPGVGAGFTTSTNFYITRKEDAIKIMPRLGGVSL
jgi:hypothetical protein